MDTLVEEEARNNGLDVKIYSPTQDERPDVDVWVRIAEDCDVVNCIAFSDPTGYCNHCEAQGHEPNRGCYTMKHARRLNKKTNLYIIP